MNLKNIVEVESADEARQIAIDWQNNGDRGAMYYSELAEAGAYFQELAEKFNLVEEFKENGII